MFLMGAMQFSGIDVILYVSPSRLVQSWQLDVLNDWL